jgi:hypothetical protein
MYHNPELVIAFNDHFFYDYFSLIVETTPAALFDTYNDNLNMATSEFLEHFFLFFTFVWLLLLFVFNFRIST